MEVIFKQAGWSQVEARRRVDTAFDILFEEILKETLKEKHNGPEREVTTWTLDNWVL